MTLLLLVLVAGGGYLAWVWVPLYFDNYTVKQVVADYMNQSVKNRDDAQLRQNMVQKIASLIQEKTVDDRGRVVMVPVIQLDERDVVWERDDATKSLHISFAYERQVVYPWLERTAVKTFVIDRTGDISLPDWGPAR